MITDSQRELLRAEREKLILLMSEIDLGETAEKINTKIQNILTDDQENNDLTEFTDAEQQESIINKELTENLQAGQQVNSANETIEAPQIESESASEQTVDVQSTNSNEVIPANEKEQQSETENPIVQIFTREPDDSSDQDIKQISCYEMGPFADKAAIQQWQNQLEGEINFLGIQSRDIQEIKDYMVIYPAAETYAKSEENASRLRELGINDLWLFEKGDNRGAISLGLFESKSIAEKARKQYKQDGLTVQIKPRFRDVQQYFISMELDKQQHDKILQGTPEMENMELSSCS